MNTINISHHRGRISYFEISYRTQKSDGKILWLKRRFFNEELKEEFVKILIEGKIAHTTSIQTLQIHDPIPHHE